MAPEYPTPTMLALDAVEERATAILLQRGDRRDAAAILRREGLERLAEAEVKAREADAMNARLNRLSLVRSRILKAAL